MHMRNLGFGLAVGVGLLGNAAVAQSAGETVTLKSFDGFTQIRGELVEFDGRQYTLRTRLGTLQIDALQVSCEGDACPKDLLFGAEFAVSGSRTLAEDLMPALIEGYADTLDAGLEREVGVSGGSRGFSIIHSSGEEMAAIDVASIDPASAFAGLADGSAAIAMSSRPLDEDAADLLRGAGLPDPRTAGGESIVALDGLLTVVHPDNPIRSISVGEIAQVFSGQITNWSDLGGRNAPINLYGREAGSGTMDTLDSLILAPNGLETAPGIQRIASNRDLSDAVSADPAGIALVPFAYRRAGKALPIRQECGILSHPTRFNIKTEEYPLSRRLYLYNTERNAPAHARRLLDFARSGEAVPYVRDAGFVSLSPDAQGVSDQGLRISYALTRQDEFSLPLMREMLTDLDGAERLSTTFRFTPGSSQLTAKSQSDAEALARQIVSGAYEGRDVLLVGFTDSIGQFALNRALAERRAQGVLFTMAAAAEQAGGGADFDGANIEIRGYGEMTPVGCNTTFAGRVANRRVEVWVR